MVVTEERLSEEGRTDTARRTNVERAWIGRLGIAWLVAITAIITLQPASTDPNAPIPWWGAVTGVLFLAALGGITVTGLLRHRSMFGISAFAGALGMVLAYGCLATGHHLGAWWLVELGAFGSLTAMSIAADRAR